MLQRVGFRACRERAAGRYSSTPPTASSPCGPEAFPALDRLGPVPAGCQRSEEAVLRLRSILSAAFVEQTTKRLSILNPFSQYCGTQSLDYRPLCRFRRDASKEGIRTETANCPKRFRRNRRWHSLRSIRFLAGSAGVSPAYRDLESLRSFDPPPIDRLRPCASITWTTMEIRHLAQILRSFFNTQHSV